ncbi:MAG TPA: 1-phosphofructokinase [Candidatus Methylomirabilis sp.]|nr:1-phosphofructokinase [Candidatus Methylomirabilis sp.]
MPMVSPIVTVTPSPALDRTLRVDRLDFGAIARVRDVREDPGGKGVNVSRVLNHFGRPTTALGFIAGRIGSRLEEELRRYGIVTDFVPVEGETRVNLTLTDGERELKVNEAGPPIDAVASGLLVDKVRRHARGSPAVVLAGSLPPGAGDGLYGELVEVVRQQGSRPVLDAEGAPLRLGVAARPFLIKPNLREAEALLGVSLSTEEDIRQAARHLGGQGIEVVVISLGGSGALMACRDRIWMAEIPLTKTVSTVGAGDSLLAYLLMALLADTDPVVSLRRATAAGLASTSLPGSQLCTPAEMERMLPLVRTREL